MDDGSEPLWRRILLHELVLAIGGAILILYIAFLMATRARPAEEESARPSTARSGVL